MRLAANLRPLPGCVLALLLLWGCKGPEVINNDPAKPDRKVEARLEQETEQRIAAASLFATGLSEDLNGRKDASWDWYYQSAQADPTNERLVIDVSGWLLRSKKTNEAVKLLKKSATRPEASGLVDGMLAAALAESGAPAKDVVTSARRGITKLPDDFRGYFALCQYHLQNKMTNEAVGVLDEAFNRASAPLPFWLDVAETYLRFQASQILTATNASPRALAALSKAEAPPDMDHRHLLRWADGFVLMNQPAKAAPIYERLLSEETVLPGVREKLVNIYLRTGPKEKASALLEEIRKENPTDLQAYIFLGGIAFDGKDYTKAAEYYETALKLNPDLEQLYYDLAGLKISLHKPAEAIEVLDRARARFKLTYRIEFFTGVAYAGLENFNEALKHLTSAEMIAKANDPKLLNHFFHYQVGAAQERLGRLMEAEASIRKALEIAPDYSEALNYLGYMLADRNEKLDEALSLVEKAVKLEPDNSAFLDSLAWALHRLGRDAEALPHMLKSIELEGDRDATLLDHLGDIHAGLKQWDKAKAAWQEALKLQPTDELRKKLRQAGANVPPK